ncbi:hypothetical protein [Candidatus Laterigemmans baculatus]|uniref:hypothetical protein n=1 Tax=Candidatus Laterigemmans baculatus TaxID=2770505 RepID=UPI0013DBC530|nr:hypothetical protein [Candidatus Laterigemmans baculatus]
MISIRPFQNIDVPAVCRLWNAHRAELQLSADLSPLTLEVAVLSRPFFDSRQLLIAREGKAALGFVHWMFAAETPDKAVVANLAVPAGSRREEVAERLLQAATEAAAADGAKTIALGQAPDDWTGYAGAAVHGLGGGIPECDAAVARWAKQAGFTPSRQLLNFLLNTTTYRPAYDRELLTLRRSVTVEHRQEVTDLPFRLAASLSHLQLHRFVAHRRSGESIAEVDLMLGDPEMLIVTSGIALLIRWTTLPATPSPANASAGPAPELRFVLATAIGQLIGERITRIEATVDAADTASTALLEQAGFTLDHRGTIFSRSL